MLPKSSNVKSVMSQNGTAVTGNSRLISNTCGVTLSGYLHFFNNERVSVVECRLFWNETMVVILLPGLVPLPGRVAKSRHLKQCRTFETCVCVCVCVCVCFGKKEAE